MTLREKLTKEAQEMPLEINPTIKDIDKYHLSIDRFKQITEEFAIGFSKFIEIRCTKTEYLHQYIFEEKEHHITSLLEIYKKEKGL